MSARNRGRGTSNQDADEEGRLWKEITEKGKELDRMITRSNEIGHEIIEAEEQQATIVNSGKPSDAALDERIEKLYRENVKISEEVTHAVNGKSNDMNFLDSIKVLAGLREASEESAQQAIPPQPPSQRNASGKFGRPTKKGSSSKAAAAIAVKEDEVDEVPAAPSPKIHLTANRLSGAKDKSSRAGSVSVTREPSVKLEDGAESVASSADGAGSTATTTKSGFSRQSGRLVLTKGEVVFCRYDPKNYTKEPSPEGEGILCRVTAVIGEGKQRRYEVQDADTTSDPPPPPQRASVAQLVQIPETNKGLSDLTKGRGVLAQYPDTTTFYKADVVDGKGEMVKLKFEDDEAARDVERRFVVSEK